MGEKAVVSVLVIRAHKRFAVRRDAKVSESGKRAQRGLLIALSLDGCRISNLAPGNYPVDQLLTVKVAGFEPLEGRVRWSRDGVVGLRFAAPLHIPALDLLIRTCRGEAPADGEARAYGT